MHNTIEIISTWVIIGALLITSLTVGIFLQRTSRVNAFHAEINPVVESHGGFSDQKDLQSISDSMTENNHMRFYITPIQPGDTHTVKGYGEPLRYEIHVNVPYFHMMNYQYSISTTSKVGAETGVHNDVVPGADNHQPDNTPNDNGGTPHVTPSVTPNNHHRNNNHPHNPNDNNHKLPKQIGEWIIHYVTPSGHEVDVLTDHGFDNTHFKARPYEEDTPDTIDSRYHNTGKFFGNHHEPLTDNDLSNNLKFKGGVAKNLYIQVASDKDPGSDSNNVQPKIGEWIIHYVTPSGYEVDTLTDHGFNNTKFMALPYKEDTPDTIDNTFRGTGKVFGNSHESLSDNDLSNNLKFTGGVTKNLYVQVKRDSSESSSSNIPPKIGEWIIHYITPSGQDVDTLTDHGYANTKFMAKPYEEDTPDTIDNTYRPTGKMYGDNHELLSDNDLSNNLKFIGGTSKNLYIQVIHDKTPESNPSNIPPEIGEWIIHYVTTGGNEVDSLTDHGFNNTQFPGGRYLEDLPNTMSDNYTDTGKIFGDNHKPLSDNTVYHSLKYIGGTISNLYIQIERLSA